MFESTSRFIARLAVSGPAGGPGRDFLFSGRPMICAYEQASLPTEQKPPTQQKPPREQKPPTEQKPTEKPIQKPHLTFDCDSALHNFRAAWSSAKKEWCCTNQKKGCDYDCEAGPSNLESGWTDDQKGFCCGNHGTGCVAWQWSTAQQVDSCSGHERHYASCENLAACGACLPQNCEWGEWNSWTPQDSCTGLCERSRNFSGINNECGLPCNGPKAQTAQLEGCLPQSCLEDSKPKDCKWSEWNEWSACATETSQSSRSRSIVSRESKGGHPCEGVLTETRPCGEATSQAPDCELSDWGMWTDCSATCGGGYRAALRHVARHAGVAGRPCDGVLRRTVQCATEPCKEQDHCIMDSWKSWEGCDAGSPRQRFRSREVLEPAGPQGHCSFPVKETSGCPETIGPVVKHSECILETWSEWSACSATCEGQTIRKRQVNSLSSETCFVSGMESMQEIAECGPRHCLADSCILSNWSSWSACSQECGTGVSTRERHIVNAEGTCKASLQEVTACKVKDCPKIDCQWDRWDEWSACSCTCNGGQKRRNRIIKEAPQDGGAPCEPKDKSEVAACNTQSCESHACINGAWGKWGNWSTCSATCAPAFRTRHREIMRHANKCGIPALGLEDDVELCPHASTCHPNIDCELSNWTAWSGCSAPCDGVRERSRRIKSYAQGHGNQCMDEDLTTVEACNPGPGESLPEPCAGTPLAKADCVVSNWDEWEPCTATCGGGQKERARHILSTARNNGIPCDDELLETASCGTMVCSTNVTCKDCEWEQWSHWSACAANQKYRRREIAHMPNFCGRTCGSQDAKEVVPCNSGQTGSQPLRFCAWSDWAGLSDCPKDCGYWTSMRQRQMVALDAEPASGVLFQIQGDVPCSGNQVNISMCPNHACEPTCQPVDCVFGTWSDWGAPSCLQLADRHRVINKVAECGGTICQGALAETKAALKSGCSEVRDCILGDWDSWKPPDCRHHKDQRHRSRVFKQKQANGGKPCDASAMMETETCSRDQAKDCVLGQWQSWSACNSGRHTRIRSVEFKAEYGGLPCQGSLEEVTNCVQVHVTNSESTRPCLMGQWAAWSKCEDDMVHFRFRQVTQQPGETGLPCEGNMREIRSCSVEVDCVVSGWTQWDNCDRTCGVGQQNRQRQVTQNPRSTGKACPFSLIESRGCNLQSCGIHDGKVGEWTTWGACSSLCGLGHQIRSRGIIHLAEFSGMGFSGDLSQSEPCMGNSTHKVCEGPKDCLWSYWGNWSECSASCGSAQRTRSRSILQEPDQGGKSCEPLGKEEVEGCYLRSCSDVICIDGGWSSWNEWQQCSSTCNGGLTKRARKVVRTPSDCGKAAVGPSVQVASCNSDVPCEDSVDCVWNDWSEWSQCSSNCSGVKRQSRSIRHHGSGAGAFCTGAAEQTAPCSARQNGAECAKGSAVDCLLGNWSHWSSCDADCGWGEKSQSRLVLREPANGGLECDGTLKSITSCKVRECPVKCKPVDCAWGYWSEWSNCENCIGEKRRSRNLTAAECGGKICHPGETQEIGECPRTCNEPKYCAWEEWRAFGACSATCGSAKKSRVRYLKPSKSQPVAATDSMPGMRLVESKFELLQNRPHSLDSRRLQDLALAWAAGSLSLMAMLGMWRSCGRSARSPGSESDCEEAAASGMSLHSHDSP